MNITLNAKHTLAAGDNRSLGKKVAVLGFLLLLSTIPRFMVESTIQERQTTSLEAARTVTEGWAARQSLGIVRLDVPWDYSVFSEKKRSEFAGTPTRITPSILDIRAKTDFEFRRRGIFRIPVYTADVVMKGSLKIPAKSDWSNSPSQVHWSRLVLTAELPKPESLVDFAVKLGGQSGTLERTAAGLEAKFPELKDLDFGKTLDFEIHLVLKGVEGMDVFPYARQSTVHVESTWPSPSFRGQLPMTYVPGSRGFSADWKFLRPSPSQQISVDYIEEVNIYQQSLRSVKYGIFITILTLAVFFLFEILGGWKLHFMQYLLLILPLGVFYVLLIAFSEHIGFALAYLIATGAVVGLIHFYLGGSGGEKSKRRAFSGILALVYALIYGLLQSTDYALLMGSVALFAALSAVMLLTRKVDWSRGFHVSNDSNSTTKDTRD
jgi:inner membrane protein